MRPRKTPDLKELGELLVAWAERGFEIIPGSHEKSVHDGVNKIEIRFSIRLKEDLPK